MRGWPLVRRSLRITRTEANTNSQSSARKPNRISCSANAEFMPCVTLRLMEDQSGVADAHHVAVAQQLAADLVAVHRRSVRRAEVVGGGEVAVELDVEVAAGDALVEQLQVGVGAAADDVAADAQFEALVGLVDDERRGMHRAPRCHRRRRRRDVGLRGLGHRRRRRRAARCGGASMTAPGAYGSGEPSPGESGPAPAPYGWAYSPGGTRNDRQ